MGRMARFFWGRPNPQGTKRLHIPIAADIAQSSADLLFSEQPTITFEPKLDDDGNEVQQKWKTKAQERLDQIFNEDFHAQLAESGELASAFGSVYFRIWWDSDIADHVLISCHPADTVVPEFRYDRLISATLWRVLDDPDTKTQAGSGLGVWRHLERHEKGAIYHGLYKGTETKLGSPMPLDAHPETQWAAELADKNGMIKTGVDRLTIVHIPNAKPNGSFRNRPGLAQLGRSDFDGIEEVFDAIDEVYSSWIADIRNGKGRLLVEETMMKPLGPGRGSAWDTDQEVFTKLPPGVGSATDSTPITSVQFNIRWQEHSQTVAEMLNVALRHAGLSARQFSDSSLTAGVTTATEVESDNAKSERTRGKKLRFYRAGLKELAKTAMLIDTEIFGTRVKFETDPIVSFPVRAMQSPETTTKILSQQRSSDLVSIEQGIRELHPNWSDPEIKEERERIRQDALESMNIAYGKAGDGAETPAPETEGQPEPEQAGEETPPEQGAWEGPGDIEEPDDQELTNLAAQLAQEN